MVVVHRVYCSDTTNNPQFKLYLESEGTPHLDWRVTIISEDMDFNELHGVLVRRGEWSMRSLHAVNAQGSSINWNGMPQLAGVEADYEVADLLSTQFKFATFRGTRARTGRRLASSRLAGKAGRQAGSGFF